MSIGSRIKQRREELGITQTELAEMLGVTKGAVGNYETDANSPKASILYKVFDVLKCDANFIFQDEEKERQDAETGRLSNAETRLISKYRALDKRGKEKVDTILNWETERLAEIRCLQDSLKVEASAKIVPMPRRLPIPLSLQPVSAGRGAYLGPEEFETIFVEENNLTKRASFAVRVSGDSMEPSYSDGDILLIQGADDIQIGEIGVFTLDGDGFVKERGDGELISLNPEYAPIPTNDSIWCNGRVIGKLAPEWMA